MATSADGYGDFLGLGVLECEGDVFLGRRLDEERWPHAVLLLVAGRGILVLEPIIVGCTRCDLDAPNVGDVSCRGCRGSLAAFTQRWATQF